MKGEDHQKEKEKPSRIL
jgi:hypothetical protein